MAARFPDSDLRLAHDAAICFHRRGDGDPASNSVQLVATPVTVPGSPDRRLSFRPRVFFWRRQPPIASLLFLPSAAGLRSRPFLHDSLRTHAIAPDTHRDQALIEPCDFPSPWRLGRPRRTLIPRPVQEISQFPWLSVSPGRPIFGWLTYAGDPLPSAAGDGDPASNPVQLVATPVTVPGSPDRRLSFRRSSALHRTAGPPSGCGSRRARACAPTPWWATIVSVAGLLCAGRSAWPRGSSGARNSAASTNAQPDPCCCS